LALYGSPFPFDPVSNILDWMVLLLPSTWSFKMSNYFSKSFT
jgi:hypothetical protein